MIELSESLLDTRLSHETTGRQIARAVGLSDKRNAHLVKLFVFIADALKRINDADGPSDRAIKLRELRSLLTDLEAQCLSSKDNVTGTQTTDFVLAMKELNRDLDTVSAAIELETEQASVTDHVTGLHVA